MSDMPKSKEKVLTVSECDWLYAEWNHEKNVGLDPAQISVGSNLKVWWILHYTEPDSGKTYILEWQAEIRGRYRNHSKCPYLTGNAVCPGFNDLQTKYPEIAEEWDFERNGDLTPDKTLPSSNVEIWWCLPYDDPRTKQHFDFKWKAPVKSRTQKKCGCPFLTNKRLWIGYNDLATLHPDLALEWNAEKNGMEASEVIGQSAKKFFWVQYYNDDFTGKQFCFEWEATINARVNGSGNPYLTGNALLSGFNDLATRHPEIASEWHPVRNGGLTPDQVFAKDSRRVWWYKKYFDTVLGKEFEFEWQTTVGSRTANNSGCPYLSGRALYKGFNDLATRFPGLAKEWDYKKNGELTPDQVMLGSRQVVWWKITYSDPKTGEQRDLSWEAPVARRTAGSGCPYLSSKKIIKGLNDLATTHPRLASEWDYERNGELTPDQVTYGSSQIVWWHLQYCDKDLDKTFDFAWQVSVNARTNHDTGCPYLSNRELWTGYNDLQTRYPEIAAEWNIEKNGMLKPTQVIATSNQVVWWKKMYVDPNTGTEHVMEWKSAVSARTRFNKECPYLTNTAVLAGLNDLKTRYPRIAAQWHSEKNGTLTPDMVFPYDKRSVWWLHQYDDPQTGKHYDFEWQATIQARVAQNTGCPYLSGTAVWGGFNDLATTHPELAAQWHPQKNRKLTPDKIYAKSKRKVWWRCDQGHEWYASVAERTKCGAGCPICRKNQKGIYYG